MRGSAIGREDFRGKSGREGGRHGAGTDDRRNEITAGAALKLSKGLSADVAYQYIRQNDRRGRTREPLFNQPPTTGLNNGLYTFHAHLFGVSLGYKF